MKQKFFHVVYIMMPILILTLFLGCGRSDYQKEKDYITQEFLHGDTTTKIKVIKIEKIKVYNPLLDDNKQNVITYAKTSFQKMLDAYNENFTNGQGTIDDVYDATKKAVMAGEKNSDGTIILYQFSNSSKPNVAVLYSHDDVYYDNSVNVFTKIENLRYRIKSQENWINALDY